jgi:hypothetical protein
MNHKEYYKEYCPGYNIPNIPPKIFCNPHCQFFIGLSKRKDGLMPICEWEEERICRKRNIG